MKYPDFLLYTTARNAMKAALVGMLGLVLTVVVTTIEKASVERVATSEFQSICADITTRIKDRLAAQAQLLRCGAAFISACDTVTRNDWKIFFEKSNIEKNLPGIEGLGFSLAITKNKLQQHIQSTRKDGFPYYTVLPPGERDFYSAIVYIEPFGGRNFRAFGYDMFSEPIRRKAMEASRDSDKATISDKVFLVQETTEKPQSGTLMYVPVYRHGLLNSTAEQRRLAIMGWVYSPYRMEDLMHGILGHWDQAIQGRINLKIFDEIVNSENSLLFDSQADVIINSEIALSHTLPIVFNGKRWILLFTQNDTNTLILNGKVVLLFVSGLIISILMFVLSLSLFNTQYRAQKIASKLTAEIEATSTRLALAARAGRIGIWDWDVVNNILIWDTQMYAFYGIPKDRFGGVYESWLQYIHPEDITQWNEEINLALDGAKDFDIEFRVCWPDRSVHNLKGLATVQRDSSGKPSRMTGTNWDITDQKEKEEALVNAKLESDAASASKSEFLSRMSHELRTPLNAILGFAQLLEMGELNNTQKKGVARILESGRSLLEMINNVLDISSIDTGMHELKAEPFRIGEVLPEIIDELKPMANDKLVSIVVSEFSCNQCLINADRYRFKQVLGNLVSNAIKFNKTGGDVTIKPDLITKESGDKSIRISVTDTGIGIREENIHNLFKPFESVDSERVDYTGRSLGLAVLKKIMDAMNGTYGVESKYGEGSTFWVELPLIS